MVWQEERIMDIFYFVIGKAGLVVLIVIIAHISIRIIDSLLGRIFRLTEIDRTLEKFVHRSTVTLMWLITIGFILIKLGADLNSIVASFGVMGFIVGFALKDTLNNFAAGMLILVNKPFIVGDFIEVKGVKGTVKTVNMSNTKLISEDKNKVMLPNSLIWRNPIINHTAYKSLETPSKKLKIE